MVCMLAGMDLAWIALGGLVLLLGAVGCGDDDSPAGVEGAGSVVGLTPMPLKEIDPQRYGSLVHSGDSFSYDIYSQATQAIRRTRDWLPYERFCGSRPYHRRRP